jgi:drug/metabolite transporter superfamily protein YnfA
MNRRAFFSQLGVGAGTGVAALALQTVPSLPTSEPFNTVLRVRKPAGGGIRVLVDVRWAARDEVKPDWFKTRGELVRAAGKSADDAAKDAFVKAGL